MLLHIQGGPKVYIQYIVDCIHTFGTLCSITGQFYGIPFTFIISIYNYYQLQQN